MLADPQTWILLVTLSSIEIVLGIDNLVFISIAVSRLPPDQRERARKFGIAAACITRIALLLTLAFLAHMKQDIFNVFGHGFSVRDLVLLLGGIFLVFKGIAEIRDQVRGEPEEEDIHTRPADSFAKVIAQIAVIDLVFVGANLLKIPQGAWMPLVLGAGLVIVMWTWTRGTQILSEKTRRDSVPLTDLMEILEARAPHRAPGTAIFLTSDPDTTPVALMHNLKHNKVLHEKNVIVTVRTAETPRVKEDDRMKMERINDDFLKVIISYGFMETPNVPKALQLCRKQGLKFDIMSTSFFLGRRSIVASATSGMPLWQDKLYIFLTKNSANPTDFFKIPHGRVVELGAQVTV